MHFCISQISYSQNMNRTAANCFWMMLRITSAHRRRDWSFYKYYVNIKKYYIKRYICIYRFFINPNSSVFDRRVITESITDGATVCMTLCTRIVNSTLHRCLWWHTRKQIIFFVTDGFYQKEGCKRVEEQCRSSCPCTARPRRTELCKFVYAQPCIRSHRQCERGWKDGRGNGCIVNIVLKSVDVLTWNTRKYVGHEHAAARVSRRSYLRFDAVMAKWWYDPIGNTLI